MNLEFPNKLISYKLQARQGFTLLEFLIYMAIVGVISLLVGGSFISLTQGRNRAESRAEVNSAVRFAMERIGQDVKDATYVYAPAEGAVTGSLVLEVNAQIITYAVANQTLTRKVNSGTAVAVTPASVKLSGLSFENYRNVNLPLLKVATSIKTVMSAFYDTGNPSKVYSQTKQSTFPNARLLDITRPSGAGPEFGEVPVGDIRCGVCENIPPPPYAQPNYQIPPVPPTPPTPTPPPVPPVPPTPPPPDATVLPCSDAEVFVTNGDYIQFDPYIYSSGVSVDVISPDGQQIQFTRTGTNTNSSEMTRVKFYLTGEYAPTGGSTSGNPNQWTRNGSFPSTTPADGTWTIAFKTDSPFYASSNDRPVELFVGGKYIRFGVSGQNSTNKPQLWNWHIQAPAPSVFNDAGSGESTPFTDPTTEPEEDPANAVYFDCATQAYAQSTYYSQSTYGPWTCGDALVDSRDSKSYTTVLIGLQCWMKENLNIGTMVLGTADQANNSTIEKYCYGNVEVNCDSEGALYQWNEAMSYVTTPGAQGICPTSWHIPTDAQYMTLEENQGMCSGAGAGCSGATGARGTDQGTKLKEGGSSGFEGRLSGYRFATGGAFLSLGTGGFFWSSSESTSSIAWRRDLVATDATVYRGSDAKAGGYSLRCVKD